MRQRLYTVSKLLRSAVFVLLLLSPLLALSQDEGKKTKKQKKAEAKKEQQVQQAHKSEVRSRKEHMKRQDKQTRKRMKKNKKRGSSYVGSGSDPGFFKRIFQKPK
jgi:hypothetical protein